MKIHSYSKPLNIGNKYLTKLDNGPVIIQEKIDGSQISFGVLDGALFVKSKNQMVDLSSPGMFQKAVTTLQDLLPELLEGAVYRGEYLQKEKHNALKYSRVPSGYIALFDIEYADGTFATPEQLKKEAEQLALSVVPTYYEGPLTISEEFLLPFLDNTSILGGVLVEGIVIKNYAQRDMDGKVVMGKLVSENFREMHKKDKPKLSNQSRDVVHDIMEGYNTRARWTKAVQHLRDNEELEGTPKDIGPLLRELAQDFEIECEDEIKDLLYEYFRKQLLKEIGTGFAQWYKNELAFGEDNDGFTAGKTT